MAVARRIESLDFWRGFVLITIFINHIPGNPVERITHRNFGFSDSAEAFIFLSGLVLAYVLQPRLEAGKLALVVQRSLKRAWELYRTHLLLTLAAVVVFSAGYLLSRNPLLLVADNRALIFDQTRDGLLGVVVLGYQLGYFNILPVYIVLMLMAPLSLILLRRSLLLGLGASAGLYLLARFGLHLPSWPLRGTWFLNPFAWQFLFTLGLATGLMLRRGPIPYWRPAMIASVVILVFALLVNTRGFGFLPALPQLAGPWLDNDKGVLGIARLAHFLALAYVVSQIRVADLLLRLPGSGEISRLGRQGLAIFAAGSVFSAIGQIVLASHPQKGLEFQMLGVVTIAAGIGAMFLLARYIEWRQTQAMRQTTLPIPTRQGGGQPAAALGSSAS